MRLHDAIIPILDVTSEDNELRREFTPPCFKPEQWKTWLETARNVAGARSGSFFYMENSYCTDCTAEYQLKMLAKRKCRYPETQFSRDEHGFECGVRPGDLQMVPADEARARRERELKKEKADLKAAREEVKRLEKEAIAREKAEAKALAAPFKGSPEEREKAREYDRKHYPKKYARLKARREAARAARAAAQAAEVQA